MRTISRYIKRGVFLLFLLVSFVNIQGQTGNQPVEVTKRRALVGPYCMVNQISSVANVATNYSHLEYITDSDLNNYASITGIKVDVLLSPVLSVKDTKNTYKGGTTAGFSLASTESGGLLSLEVIQLFSITTYLNGKEQETIAVGGASSGGVGLDLIKIPGSDAVSVDVCVKTTKDFDEIYLMQGGLHVEAINQLSIRYAFVGDPKEVLLTYDGVETYGIELGLGEKGIQIDYDKCDGMPWPVKDKPLREDTFHDKLFDSDTTNYLGTGGLAIGEWFHAQIGTTYEFPAGTEVGFKYFNKGLLDLSLGSFVTITLYDKNNKEVQTETLSAGILKLGVVTTGEITSAITSKVPFYSARLTVGAGALSVNLGGVGIYYGFVREKPEIDHHCPIQPSLSATVCDNVTTYELRSNPDVKVKWELTNFEFFSGEDPRDPQEVMNNVQIGETANGVTKVTGLTVEGVYTFKATAVDCTAEPPCSETVTLTKGVRPPSSSCGTPVFNADGNEKYELSTSTYGVTGGLISISDIKDKTNILDGNFDNYASYVSGLSVASNLGIIGIKTVGGESFDLGIEGDKRVGFIVENASTFLDADVLQFLRIRLFRNGEVVYENVIDESNVVGVGLIGSEQSQKIRYSVKVPANVDFDEFQLWTSGVLNLGLNTLRIYYGFMESADDDCSDPLKNGCALAVSTEETNASLSLQIPFQTVSVAGTLVNGDLLLDGDMNTALTYTPAVGVGTGLVLCVKLGRTMDKTQQLGLALDSKTFVLGAGVGSWITVSTYLNGQETGEKFSDWNTVGLDVIGYGDRRYLISQPTLPYDEVRIAFAAVVSALEGYNLYGLFFRSDIDGDGLPDCMDPESCAGGLANLRTTPHICEGEKVVLYGQAKFEEEEEKDYKMSIFKKADDIQTAEPVFSKTFTIHKGIFQQEIWEATEAGEYKLIIYDKDDENTEFVLSELYFTVHPLETTWLENVTGTDWNAWENWSKGSPWTCTNVIIPESAQAYPILEADASNGCNYIHFEPNAEVKNTHHLDYKKAWVDIELSPNRYYMVAAPLKRIYSGDWFVAANGIQLPDTFTSLTANNYPENRVTPTIYQRIWDAAYMEQLINSSNRPFVKPGDKVDIAVTGWTKPFNWLATPYDKNTLDGQEFDFNALSVWVHPLKPSEKEEGDNGQTYTFRFPKEHTEYHYYDEKGTQLSVGVRINDRNNSGRFIYEQEDGKATFPVVMRFKNGSFNNNTFLVGNPFMTHIDVKKFLERNEHIASVKIYDGQNGTANSLIHNLDGDGILEARPGNGGDGLRAIAPTQSFFVTCEERMVESCTITFTEDMLETQPELQQANRLSRKQSASVASRSVRLMASADNCQSGALVYFSQKANDHYRENEDAEVLLENEINPTIALFTIAEQRALDIQQRANGGEIPLGIYLAKPADVNLSITIPESYSGWILKDLDNNRIHPLLAGKENKIELGRLTTNIGRFCLKGESIATSNGVIAATQPKVFCYRDESGGQVIVRSTEGLMRRCDVFTIDGRMSGRVQSESAEYRLPIAKGAYVVKVYLRDGTSAVVKVF